MERSTQIDEHGYYLTGDGIYSDWGMPEKFRGDDIDRLAAYEDTGLEPEEVRSQKELFDYLVFDSTPSEDIERFKRLRELAEADREGRCVVLPRLETGRGDPAGDPGPQGPPGLCPNCNDWRGLVWDKTTGDSRCTICGWTNAKT